jgi:hypothetical protein
VLLLSRIKARLGDELSHVPNYTCLETIARFHKEGSRRIRSLAALQPLDTVALEIVYSNHREWYGSPGDRSLSVDNPATFVGAGLIGDGPFALGLAAIIHGASFTYRGEETVGGRLAVRYDYHLSAQLKPLTTKTVRCG